jgi:hypothetical protein
VVLSRDDKGLAARVRRYAASGEQTWDERFPKDAWTGECATLIDPLVTQLWSLLLNAPPPEPAPSPEPAPAPPTPPPALAPPAPTVEPAKAPEPANVPNPARSTASRVAIVAYSFAGAFLGLGIGWTIDAQSKANSAAVLTEQLSRSGGGQGACASAGHAPATSCIQLLTTAQSVDTAATYRNAWYGAAGVSAAVGLAASVYAVSLPNVVNGQPAHVSIGPSGFVIQGSF